MWHQINYQFYFNASDVHITKQTPSISELLQAVWLFVLLRRLMSTEFWPVR